MYLQGIKSSAKSQSPKVGYYIIYYILAMIKIIEIENRLVVARGQGWGTGREVAVAKKKKAIGLLILRSVLLLSLLLLTHFSPS